jgi:vacuole morphology and inheritance protein 14
VADQTNQALLALVKETSKDFKLNPLLLTLIRELTSHHIPTRMAALRWINMLLEKAPQVKGTTTAISTTTTTVVSILE